MRKAHKKSHFSSKTTGWTHAPTRCLLLWRLSSSWSLPTPLFTRLFPCAHCRLHCAQQGLCTPLVCICRPSLWAPRTPLRRAEPPRVTKSMPQWGHLSEAGAASHLRRWNKQQHVQATTEAQASAGATVIVRWELQAPHLHRQCCGNKVPGQFRLHLTGIQTMQSTLLNFSPSTMEK